MSGASSERFIETSMFPVDVVSRASAVEKAGGGRPPFWEMAFWWTRKPLAGARAVIAGCLLPKDVDVNEFLRALRLNEKVVHSHKPVIPEKWRQYFAGKKLLDPFAGFGNIPLEALRLGLSVTAVELLPTAYVFLKGVLEYPLEYGEQLIRDVEKWGKWITEQLRNDPLIKQLYDEDVAVYIGSWEIKCPHCRKWTILIGNWWLARVSKERGAAGRKKKIYHRLAWMRPKVNGDLIKVEVVDLNKELGDRAVENAKVDTRAKPNVVTVGNKKYLVPLPNINANKEDARCLHCGNAIRYIDPATGNHYLQTKNANKEVRNRLIWYVKYALGTLTTDDPKLVRLKLLIRVNKRKEFAVCNQEDQKKLDYSKNHVEKFVERKDPDVPNEVIAPYSTRFLHPLNYYAKTWRDLHNARQLLVLVKLTKILREAGKLVEQEKIKESLNHQDARKYAEALATYLAIAFTNFVDNFTLVTSWHNLFLMAQRTMAFRGITMTWNWCDVNPFAEVTGSWVRSLSSVVDGLRYLVSAVCVNISKNIGYRGDLNKDLTSTQLSFSGQGRSNVLLSDASLLNLSEKFDLIVTDPPYYSDVPYSELSDFYYVWLKRTLSDVQSNQLIPRYLPEAFFKKIGAKFVEIGTQWKEYGEREVAVKLASKEIMEEGEKRFLELLKMSFINCNLHLSENALLTTYYAHTSPEAWIALLQAGWKGAKSYVVNAFPLATESLQRATARGKYALDTSIVVTWKKGASGSTSTEELYDKAVKTARAASLGLVKARRVGSDLFVGTMASILSSFTRYENVYSPIGILDVKSLVTDYVYPATAKALAMALGEFAGAPSEVKKPESLFYLITKALFEKPPRAKRKLDRSTTALLSIGTRADLDTLEKLIIIKKEKEIFYLEEPETPDRKSYEELLGKKDINPAEPVLNSSIDALHLLEYYAATLPMNAFLNRFSELKGEYSSEVEEAINIATILSKTLPTTDPEKQLCEEIIARLRGERLA